MCVYIKPSAHQITYYIDNSFSMPLLSLYAKYEAKITESGDALYIMSDCIVRMHRVFGIRIRAAMKSFLFPNNFFCSFSFRCNCTFSLQLFGCWSNGQVNQCDFHLLLHFCFSLSLLSSMDDGRATILREMI